jgi:hypothetical protein
MRGDVGLEREEEILYFHVTPSVLEWPGSESACTHQGSADNTTASDRLICSATILQHHLQDPTRSHNMSGADDSKQI